MPIAVQCIDMILGRTKQTTFIEMNSKMKKKRKRNESLERQNVTRISHKKQKNKRRKIKMKEQRFS